MKDQAVADAADESAWHMYFQAYGPNFDVIMPFVVLIAGACFAALLPPMFWARTSTSPLSPVTGHNKPPPAIA